MKKKMGFMIAIGLLAALFAVPVAEAQDVGEADRWKFTLFGYAWLTAIDGDATVRGRPADVHVSFSDTFGALDDLKFGVMLHSEAKKGRLSLILDGLYASFEGEETRSGTGESTIKVAQGLAEVGAAYQVYSWPVNIGTPTMMGLEFLGGGRFNHLRAKIDYETSASDVVKTKNWVDPFFGARLLWKLGDRWLFTFRSDIGGFGAGSDIAVNLNGAIAYKLSKWVSLAGGYRGLYTDYDSGSGQDKFEYKTWMHGPWLGIGTAF
jgi:hypothetical protein